jgi:diguanylate cyclase (GGDEF)-like protein/PAS domain S-box-containing protein
VDKCAAAKTRRLRRDGFPSRLIAAALAISVLATAAGSIVLWRLHDRFDALHARETQLDEYLSQVRLFDEVLTMSVRMAAATGDLRFEERYQKYDAELDALIKKTVSTLGLSEVRQFVEQTDEANRKLVQIERSAFALVHEDRRAEAAALLTSDEYSKWKDLYTEGVEKTIASHRGEIQRQMRDLAHVTVGFGVAGGAVMFALLLSWYVAIRAGRRWSRESMQAEAALQKARDELDLRVKERTAELQVANETLRKESEALVREEMALRESQQIIAAILDAVPARIFWKDRDLVYLGCNAPFARDAGFARPDDVVGKDDRRMGWCDDAERIRRDEKEIIETGRAKLLVQETRTTPEGKIVTFTSRVPLRRPTGEVFGLLGAYMDITERARLEEQLEARNVQFEAALNNMAQGLLMFDRDGKLVISNRRFAELLGLPWKEWKSASMGKSVVESMQLARKWISVSEKTQEQIVAELQVALERKTVSQIVFELADGRTFSTLAAPMTDGGFVATFDDITEKRRSEERISHLVHYDALTDLPNRALFYEDLEHRLARVPQDQGFAVFSLDFDHFKNVNDLFGHPVGDKLLQAAARRMNNCIRDTDMVARLGGDEFAAVQSDIRRPAEATVFATRLIDALSAPYELDGHQIIVGVSIGIAMAPGDGTTPDQLMKNADLALARCKADRGNTYRFFEAEVDARMQERRAIELDLRKALMNNEFTLEYQPIVNLKTGKITACEALVRWRQPERGLVPPLRFVPIAEETGLIIPIGERVLMQACADAATWPGEVAVTVNVSPVQFRSGDFAEVVKMAIEKSELPSRRLELEITELVLMDDRDAALFLLRQLKKLGISIAMDDFGTGYSSLAYLRSFPFDRIKIDQSFIHDLTNNKESLAILRAVVSLGNSLNIVTTAEGVETAGQLEMLRAEGCTDVQGFFFGPPRPAAETREMLAALHGSMPAVA